MDLLIKTYFPTSSYPLGGQLTNYIWENCIIGKEIEISGPKGKLIYENSGIFLL